MRVKNSLMICKSVKMERERPHWAWMAQARLCEWVQSEDVCVVGAVCVCTLMRWGGGSIQQAPGADRLSLKLRSNSDSDPLCFFEGPRDSSFPLLYSCPSLPLLTSTSPSLLSSPLLLPLSSPLYGGPISTCWLQSCRSLRPCKLAYLHECGWVCALMWCSSLRGSFPWV